MATAGETAVTASALSPSARWASAATTDESTPPENATTTLPSSAMRASSARSRAPCVRRRDRACAHTTFTGSPLMRAARSQSACSGARLTILPSSLPTLITDGLPVDLDREALALELDPVEVGDAHAERARLAQHRLGDRALVAAGARAPTVMKRGPAALHLHGRGPDVERAGLEAGRGGVGRELGQQVVEVGLDQRDARRSRPRVPRITRTTFGSASRSRVPAP